MKVKFLGTKGTWREVANSANTTIHKDPGEKEPSSLWKKRMLLCEHSPIRQLVIKWKWYDLKFWVSVHFVRHWLGIVHWVRTERTDRTGVDRNDIPQGALVEHEAEANAQALINISRRRKCMQASPETRAAWNAMLDECVKESNPELYAANVPDCIYRGWCYEFKTCGFFKTDEYKKMLAKYREGINEFNNDRVIVTVNAKDKGEAISSLTMALNTIKMSTYDDEVETSVVVTNEGSSQKKHGL